MSVQFKNGPGREDFGEMQKWYVRPEGDIQYDGKVIVLTNQSTASAAEFFTIAMKRLPNVIQMGEKTAGVTSWPSAERQLPNGWLYGLSVGRTWDSFGIRFDSRGVKPHIEIQDDFSYPYGRFDPVLQQAINYSYDMF